MFRFTALLAIILLFDIFYIAIFDIKFGKALPLSFITCSFLMFFSTLAGKLSYFKYFFTLFLFILAVLVIIEIKKKNTSFKQIFFAFLRPSLAVFVLFFIYLFFVDSNQSLSQIDDFFRWGGKVRDAIINDSLYAPTALSYVFADVYPPFLTLMQVFFNKVLGGYNESWSLFAVGSFVFSLLVPFLDKFKWNLKGCISAAISSALILASLLTVSYNREAVESVFVFNTTYVDWVTSVLLAYGLYLVFDFKNGKDDYFSLLLINAALMQTDRISLVFMLMIEATLLARLLIKKELTKKVFIGCFLTTFLLPFLLYAIWRFHVGSFNSRLLHELIATGNNMFFASLKAGLLSLSAVKTFDFDLFFAFIRNTFFTPIYYHPFKISFALFMLLITVAFTGIYLFHREDIQINVLTAFYIIGAIGHLLVLLIAYEYRFSDYEAVRLAQFPRYCCTYSLTGIVLLCGLFIYYFDSVVSLVISMVVVLLFVEPASINTLKLQKIEESYRYKEREALKNYVEDEYNGEKTLIVNQWDMTYKYALKYTYGIKGKGNITTLQIYEGRDEISGEDFDKLISEYDFILIGDYDDFFKDMYWRRISDKDCYNSSLYRILHNEDGSSSAELAYIWE